MVADKHNQCVQVFTLAGVFLRQWDRGHWPWGVAVRGDKTLVFDASNPCVYVYALDGTFVRTWNWTIGGQFEEICGLAVTHTGQVLVVDYRQMFGCSRVHVME